MWNIFKANTVRYDVVFANGILYHMHNPMELLELLGQTTDRMSCGPTTMMPIT